MHTIYISKILYTSYLEGYHGDELSSKDMAEMLIIMFAID